MTVTVTGVSASSSVGSDDLEAVDVWVDTDDQQTITWNDIINPRRT